MRYPVKTIICILALAGTYYEASGQAANDWENPQVNSIGREPARNAAMPLASVKAALTDSAEPETPYVRSLNGIWKISWCGDPTRRPMDFWKTDFNDSDWQTIDVPGCVELRGFGNPGYTNVTYPHDKSAIPAIRDYTFGTPDYNPVSSYRTVFTVPAEWAGRDVFLRFDGVYSAYYLWINGEKVGYAEDSKLPSEFNVTKYLRQGSNLLAVEVYRWCDGSFLEDQDMFRFSGIFRDVTLFSTPKQAIRDFTVRTPLSDDCRSASVEISVDTDAKDVSAELYDASFKSVGKMKGANASLNVKKPHLWSAEDPYLYTLVIKAGSDIRSCKVGLRKVEIVDNIICINGRKVKFKGVNRHEHSAVNGRTVTREEMLEDILLMKRNNINTVRTCHYPDHHAWYDLCDKYGIYVVAEANVEGHGMGYKENALGMFPEWEKSIVERNVNNVVNYRNHACVFMWSLGNETGHGPCFEKALAEVKAADPTRIVHWERGNSIADVDSKMYPSVEWLAERGNVSATGLTDKHGVKANDQTPGKAFFMCEYAHAMGNSMGNFQEYWDVFYSSDILSGGCIWDWVDQALIKNTGRFDGEGKPVTFYAYGGDWDEIPNDGPFCCNGVIRPDRKPTAKLAEVKHVYRQISVESSDASKGMLTIWNRFSFTDASSFAADWELLEDGMPVASGKWTIPSVAPLTRTEVAGPAVNYKRKDGKEYFLNIYFRLAKDELWASKGHVVASAQLPFGKTLYVGESPAKASYLMGYVEDDKSIEVSSARFKAVFSRKAGTLVSLEIDGKQILADKLQTVAGPRLSCNRAFVDNDIWLRNYKEGNRKMPYTAYGLTQLNWQSKGMKLTKNTDGTLTVVCNVDVTGSKSAGFTHTATWSFKPDGTISVRNDIEPYGHQPAALPRLGLSLLVNPELEQVRWYGRGPLENYVDRCTGSFLRVWDSTVTDMYEEYVRPQDNGYRSDVRWLSLSDKKGKGVRISGDCPLFFQALHYSWDDLMYARHTNKEERRTAVLQPRKEICLNVDLRQLGLGGASCGPKPMEKYIFPIQKESFTLTFSPAK